jgi:hypothetical protein
MTQTQMTQTQMTQTQMTQTQMTDTQSLPLPPRASLGRGWDCCIDCDEQREICSFEITCTMLTLCKELMCQHPRLSSLVTQAGSVHMPNQLLYEQYKLVYADGEESGRSCRMNIYEVIVLLLDEKDRLDQQEKVHDHIYSLVRRALPPL